LEQIVSRSRDTFGCKRLGEMGSSLITCSTVSNGVAALNGGRPVNNS
jgi:hypothetical protein